VLRDKKVVGVFVRFQAPLQTALCLPHRACDLEIVLKGSGARLYGEEDSISKYCRYQTYQL
jgi:hypothetical protein